ncbi:DUF3800 domain-containing protein [Natronospora cellulosivora (SeqCode)]
MDIYNLYLDESKANTQMPYFCLGGCIIKKDVYENRIVSRVNSIKREVFSTDEIILHEIDLRRAEKEPYIIMRRKEKRDAFWERMINLFAESDLFYTLGAAVNPFQIKKLYNNHEHVNDDYFIALQIILENFTHFLEYEDAKGAVFIESRNPTEDQRMQNHFHTLKANGTLFLNKNLLQRRLTTISFPLKVDNNIGLQLADFIPNPISRSFAGKKQKSPSLFNHIVNKYYDGNLKMPNRFGLKKIP